LINGDLNVDIILISTIFYLVNIALAIIVAAMIINKLYISKKFSKENDFHLYNDLFSWEMFFIFIGIANLITIISTMISFSPEISKFFNKINFFLLFNAFWIKIIHLERVMDKVTYEKHFIPGVIPIILLILILFIELPYFTLILIFIAGALIPYLFLIIFLKNRETSKLKTVKIIIGTVLIGFVYILTLIILDSMKIVVPISFILGTLIIFESFRKEMR
jgi:hypothetical protein